MTGKHARVNAVCKNTGKIRARRAIGAGEEVLMKYIGNYWQYRQRHAPDTHGTTANANVSVPVYIEDRFRGAVALGRRCPQLRSLRALVAPATTTAQRVVCCSELRDICANLSDLMLDSVAEGART